MFMRGFVGRQGNSTDSQYLSLYIIGITTTNHLVWGIYRDLAIQDGKSLSLSCCNISHLRCFKG